MSKKLVVPPRFESGFQADIAGSELYQRVAEETQRKFGRDSKQYYAVMDGINPENGTGSQFFFNTQLGLYLSEGQRVARFDDWGRIANDDLTKPTEKKFFDGTFWTVSTELILRTKTPSYEPNTQFLDALVSQVGQEKFSPDKPLRIFGFGLVEDIVQALNNRKIFI